MARVIKAGGGQKPARPGTRVLVDAGPKKVIEREVFQAKQDAEHILRRAEEQRLRLLAEGKRQAAQAREEAMARGASEAFAAAAAEALTAFRLRADRYAEAADDIRALALEVMQKILGAEPDLGAHEVEKTLARGMAQLRARRRLRLQLGFARLAELSSERPNLMKALQSEPDLVVEGVEDVNAGFVRVVTEVGGALCAEDAALDVLSTAVNVREQPRSRVERSPANALVGTKKFETPKSNTEGSSPDSDAKADDDPEATRNLPARTPRQARRDASMESEESQEIEEIAAHEELDADRTGRNEMLRAPPIVQVGMGAGSGRSARGATRVLPIDAPRPVDDDDADATLRATPRMSPHTAPDESDEDGELELFTDDAVKPRTRR